MISYDPSLFAHPLLIRFPANRTTAGAGCLSVVLQKKISAIFHKIPPKKNRALLVFTVTAVIKSTRMMNERL
jgi:hypothetical protein